MMRFLLKIIAFFCVLSAAHSQGFDWQYSARLPFQAPVLFVGVGGRYDFLKHVGNVNYIEGVYQWATFETGEGKGLSLGGHTEYWQTGFLAYTGALLYNSVPAVFVAEGDALPLASGDIFKTEYEFSSQLHYLTLEGGAKYRLFESHLFMGGALQVSTRISQTSSQKERIVSPAEGHFKDNSQERVFDADITGFSRFLVAPQILVGYDLPVGMGYYVSPALRAGISLNSISDNASWRKINFSLGISFVKGVSFSK